jgi:hypothetical protein
LLIYSTFRKNASSDDEQKIKAQDIVLPFVERNFSHAVIVKEPGMNQK